MGLAHGVPCRLSLSWGAPGKLRRVTHCGHLSSAAWKHLVSVPFWDDLHRLSTAGQVHSCKLSEGVRVDNGLVGVLNTSPVLSSSFFCILSEVFVPA